MASYNIHFRPSVEKDFRRLPKKIASNVLARIEKLKQEPFPSRVTKLEGAERLYRLGSTADCV